ncbi:hypothetical protein GCM10025768_08180 [Microbacterium pseudoresistens]|uniref:Cell wall protein n=1 Tax=Microbacterium pseudoresistens TaxID=640634 RepID=A0A7Y9JPH7_9MICO|nr:lamin tail domain-containing protein [Microbacterium pseudoresistens]NYD54654.1 hypothetical protein [Microbacterium pseudoresistens]
MSRLRHGLAAASACALGAALLAVPPAFAAEPGIRINEVESSGGTPGDWIEFLNPTDAPIDLGGYRVQDDSDKNPYTIPAGIVVQPGEFLVLDELIDGEGDFDFGLGGTDRVRLFDPAGALETETAWAGHAATTWGARVIDGAVEWAVTAEPTKGAENVFPDDGGEGGDDDGGDPGALGTIRINEVDSQPADWVEFVNTGAALLDISGYEIRDNSDDHRWAFPAGSVIEPGGYLVVDEASIGIVDGEEAPFRDPIGIGSADMIRLFDPSGSLVDETGAWEGHAAIDGDFGAATLARCPDGEGAFVLAYATPGAANTCVSAQVVINEVESDGGSPDDWIELGNPMAETADVSGFVVKDEDDGHSYTIPAGTTIDPGGYLVIERDELGFGLGGGDAVRLFDGDVLLEEVRWGDGHAPTTWGRCPDLTGDFDITAEPTKGAANVCGGDIPVSPWLGSPDVRVLDTEPMFLEDSSGLDTQETAEGTFLWAVDNGEGRIWKLTASPDGSVAKADGWSDGKRVRFSKDAADPGAAGPDTEGITVDGDGLVYVAVERDNSAKGVNLNMLLQVDPDSAPGDLIAQAEWDLTDLLPAVGANLGIEAVEWVPDAELAGALYDDAAGARYDPAAYPGHGDGLFFVAMEDNGHVYAFALAAGAATLVAEIDPGLAGVMGLDYDAALGVLWAVCDDGCHGRSAQIALNGTAQPGIVHIAAPSGLPDINNEGFATAPASLSIDGQRPVWWFADGYSSEALRVGSLPGGTGGGGDGGGAGGDGDGPDGGADPGDGSGGDGGSGSRPDDGLAVTGVEPAIGAAVLGLSLLLAGAIALTARRRRRA